MNADPFAALGLDSSATADEVRDARRRLAREHHPDRGGDADRMRAVNEAADAALAALAAPRPERRRVPDGTPPEPVRREGPGAPERGRVQRDMPSFTVEALPVETFEGLLVVASWLGEVVDEDPPYRLDVHVHDPVECWCRLDVVPDAGSSTVSLTVVAPDGRTTPDIEAIRDVWIDQLNRVDWDGGP